MFHVEQYKQNYSGKGIQINSSKIALATTKIIKAYKTKKALQRGKNSACQQYDSIRHTKNFQTQYKMFHVKHNSYLQFNITHKRNKT